MAESYQFIFIFLLIFTAVIEFYLGTRQKQFVLKNKIKDSFIFNLRQLMGLPLVPFGLFFIILLGFYRFINF